MATIMDHKIDFNVLVRSQASGQTPDLSNIDLFRPDPEDIEKCRQWLGRKGVTCYPTDFGLACHASRDLFESLFSTRLEPQEQRPGKPQCRLQRDPKIPAEIADYITEITLTVPPELF
jgi:hypothetical protein